MVKVGYFVDIAIPPLPQGEREMSSRAMMAVIVVAVRQQLYSCPSSVSPPETSTLPGAGSRLSFLTTPSSTSIE